PVVTAPGALRGEVVEALAGLGFPAKQAEQAVDRVLSEGDGHTTSSVLRAALAALGRKR
ncbi:RuvA C-terminal domain-containing protein, partial [Amycolatopsis sp. NPDC000740]